MSNSKLVTGLLKSTPHLALLSLSLGWTYFTLGWKVRKTRRAFEKQLTAQGMSKEDAKQLSEFLLDFKNTLTTTVRQGIASRGFS